MNEQTRCARCRRVAPAQDSDAFLEWEALGDGGQVICPDCVTPAEQQAMDEDIMAMADKVRENRLRRMAERQGLRLEKSRRRDPRALDYGNYWLVEGPAPTQGGANWRSRRPIVGGDYGADLDAIEEVLTDGTARQVERP